MGTYTTAYKSGTFNGTPTGTNITVAGATPAAGDVGRFLIVTNGSANLQIREITGVSGQDYTIAHAFNACAFTGVTEVTPASGNTWALSYDIDDLIATDADLTVTGNNNLAIAALVMKTNAYISCKNYDIEFNSSNIECWINAGLILGTYGYVAGEDAYALNSCNVTDTVSGTAGEQMAGSNGNNNPSIGSFHMYGGDVYIANNCFWRLYQGSTSAGTACCTRFIDVRFNGLMGGRLEGDLSIVIASGALSSSIFGLFNFLEIARIQLSIFDSSQALYIHRSIAPTGRSTLTRLVGITSWVVYSTGSDTGATVYEIIGKKSEIDAVPAFINNTVVDADHIYRYGNMIQPTFIDATGELLVTDIKTVLFDTGDNTINTETVTDGNYTPLFARHTDIVTPVVQEYDISDGTLYAPYELNSFAFGYQIASSPISLEDTYENAVLFLAETRLTETVKATIDAYTGLETAAKIFDAFYAEEYDNHLTEGKSDLLFSRVGSQVDIGANNLVVDSAAASVRDITGTTGTAKAASFTAGVTGTGSYTVQGAVTLNGNVFDNTGGVVYNSSVTTLTNVTANDEFRDDTARTLTMDGCTIDTIRSTQGASLIINAVNTTITNNPDGVTINNTVNLTVDSIQTGSNVRIEKVSDSSLISQGAESGGSYTDTYNFASNVPVKIIVRKYGYQTNEFLGTITSSGLSASANQLTESFVVATEAAALAYTGITEDFSAGTVSLGEDHTVQELFDYLNARAAVLTNLQYDTMISTVNGVTRTGTFNLTVGTTFSLNGTGTLDIGSNTLTLSGTGSYGDDVIIIHSAGTNKTIVLTNVMSGRAYRIQKQSDDSLVYEGTASGTTVSIKHLHTGDIASKLITGQYAYLRFDTLFTIDDAIQSIQVNNVADSFAVVAEGTAAAYTGISLTFATAVGSLSESHTIQEIYDYHSYQQAQTSNLTYSPMISTTSGLEIHFELAFTVGTGGTLTSATQTAALDGGDSITTSGSGAITAPVSIATGGQLVTADIDDVTGAITMTGTGDWEINAQGTAPAGSSSATATIEITTAAPSATFDFTAFTFNAATVLENSSGNNITVDVGAGNTLPTKLETSGTITFTQNASITAPNILDNSYVRLYNVTKAAELDLSTVSGGGGYSYTADTATAGVDIGDTIRLDVACYDGASICNPLQESSILSASGIEYTGAQTTWTVLETIHAKGTAYEGANVTGLSLDVGNLEVDSNVTKISGWKNATWLYYQISTTADGMRNYFKAFSSLNLFNFEVDSSIVDLKVDNIGLPATWEDASWTRSDGASIVADGSGNIQFANGLINVVIPTTTTPDVNVIEVNGTATTINDFRAKATLAL